MLKYKYVIWDWNGTILNDIRINFEIINFLLSERNLPVLDSEIKYKNLFSFPITDFYKNLGFTFKDEPFETVAREYAFLYDEKYPSAEVPYEIEKVLRSLKQQGVNQLIVSATEQSFLIKQVTYFEIEHFFTHILGTTDIYVKSKAGIAQKWLRESGADPKEILLVGDTVHDKEVADSIGCDCLIIPNGHQSRDVLLFAGCNLCENIKDIEKTVVL